MSSTSKRRRSGTPEGVAAPARSPIKLQRAVLHPEAKDEAAAARSNGERCLPGSAVEVEAEDSKADETPHEPPAAASRLQKQLATKLRVESVPASAPRSRRAKLREDPGPPSGQPSRSSSEEPPCTEEAAKAAPAAEGPSSSSATPAPAPTPAAATGAATPTDAPDAYRLLSCVLQKGNATMYARTLTAVARSCGKHFTHGFDVPVDDFVG